MLELVRQSSDERVAILLRALGPALADQILMAFPGQRPAEIRKMIRELETEEVDTEIEGEVLVEFERFLRFATAQQSQQTPADGPGLRIADTGEPDAAESDTDENGPSVKLRRPFEPTGDPVADLNQLSAYQVAKALDGEHPKTAAIVLKQLAADTAAGILPLLPESARSDVFLQMNREDSSSPQLIDRIVRTTVAKAIEIEEPEGEELDADGRAASLLRSLDKTARTEMLEALQAEDAEMAERVRGLLYEFEDILRLTSRSVQKLLGEFDIDTLSAALKGAPEEMLEQVQGNLSRRARDRLTEEMELASADDDAVEAARKEIAEAMGRLDQAGELKME